MTISRKLNKSITTALITLLVLSTFIGLISVAGAVNSPSTIQLLGSKTSGSTNGQIIWTDTAANQGTFSVRMITTGTQTAEIKIPANFQFGTYNLANVNQLNATMAVAAYSGTSTDLLLKLYMDSNSDGTSDYYFTTEFTPALSVSTFTTYNSADSWTPINVTQGGTKVHDITEGTPDTYANWKAAPGFAADTVVAVSVLQTGANTVFCDNIGLPTAYYNLEPVALTLNQATATVQQTTPTAAPGDTVFIMAAAGTFNANELVSNFFAGIAGALSQQYAKADGGYFGWFTVPEKATGAYTITSLGTISGKTFTGTFTVATPTLTLTPSLAVAGSTFTLGGTNWNLGGKYNVTFNGVNLVTSTATVGTPAAYNSTIGASTSPISSIDAATAVVPNLPVGAYTVTATDGINSASATFTIPAPQIRLVPTSGPVGKEVTVQGAGFSRAGLVQIFFGGQLLTSTTADAIGNLTNTVGPLKTTTITIPDNVAGAYSVIVVDVTTGQSSNTATYTISSPTIKVAPSSGPSGTNLVINGTNFKVGATVTLKFNGTTIFTTGATDGNGAFANTTTGQAVVPNIVAGSYPVTATDGANTASATFTVPEASITLTPNAGPAATSFNVVGSNFKVGSTVTIYFNGTAMASTATATATGTFTQAEIVPSYPIGAYTVNATDGIVSATATFNIGAAISGLNATSGAVGSGIQVSGQGFTGSSQVDIYFGSTLVKTVNATGGGSLSSTGAQAAKFIVPDVTYGIYAVTAIDVVSGVTTPVVNYTVLRPTLTLAPTENQVGTVVIATGAQYKLDSTVSIYFNGVLVATLTADHTGALAASPNANFTVPSVVPGAYTVNATDGVNYITATFNVFGSGGIDQVLTIVTDIQATLAEYGTFYNFTNNWFMTIDAKLGNFTGDDTVASLLYSIQSQVNLPSELVFDFGSATPYNPSNIHITNTSLYDSALGYGWTDTTGLQWRDRAMPNDALRAFVNSITGATFQVALPNGNYVVAVTQGDVAWAHDGMTIIANGELVSTVDTTATKPFEQTTFTVTVEDGLLQLTFGKATGAVDGNWVVNGLVIRQAFAPAQ